MTADLGSQLERYTRAVADQQTRISPAEAQALVDAIRELPEPLRQRPSAPIKALVAGAAAAAVVVLLLAVPLLLSLVGEDTPPATTLPTVATTSTSTAPTTTTPSEQVTTTTDAPSMSTAEVSTLPAVETALGTVSWTTVAGRNAEIPSATSIIATPDGGFLAVEFPYVYASSDGIRWTVTAIPTTDEGDAITPFPPFIDQQLADYPWSTIDAPTPLYRQGNDWRTVELGDEIPDERPSIEGLRWTELSYDLAVKDAVVVAHVTSLAIVPWDEILGPRDGSFLWYDMDKGQLTIGDPEGELDVIDVTIESVDPLDIVFTDTSTGQEIHHVTGPNPGVTEAEIVEGLANVFRTAVANYSSWLVSQDGGASFHPMDAPWASSEEVEVVAQGVSGYIYATRATSPNGSDGSLEIMRTADGETWESLGQPEFAPSAGFEGNVNMYADHGVLRFVTEHGLHSTEWWESVDGRTWTYLGEAPTEGNLGRHPDLGWIITGGDGKVYVSQDFASWQVLVTGPHMGDGVEREGFSQAGAKAAGDAIFMSTCCDPSGQRLLWIARVDS